MIYNGGRRDTLKYDLIAMIWPALVGVLAATLILDKWVLDHPDSANTQSSERLPRCRCSSDSLGRQHIHGKVGRYQKRPSIKFTDPKKVSI